MRQCLTNPDGGYYTSTASESDQFGKKGDFITSPEISQIFGELVGVWFMTEWMAQGRPKEGVQFMELGPGRGTLMSDMLRTIGQFKTFINAVDTVWMVEAGEGLMRKQKDLLCGEATQLVQKQDGGRAWYEAKSIYGGVMIKWVEDIALLPQQQENTMPFVVAHEFFDALPIHAFESVAPRPEEEQKTELLDNEGRPMVRTPSSSKQPQWRELLVAPAKRKFSLPEIPTSTKQTTADFQLTLAHASNPTSLVLPEQPRYRHLKSKPGSRVEISPDSSRYISAISRLIGPPFVGHKPSGAALVVDYGQADTIPINSLRGIRQHSIVSPFQFAGQADLSADVDFTALADSALVASPNVEVHGPVEQGVWLSQLGIQDRAERLMKTLKKKEDWAGENELKKKEFEMGWRRLVEGGPKGMGKVYKVMSIVPENGGKRRPVGFGGGVVG